MGIALLLVVVFGFVLVTALTLPLGIALLARNERSQKRAEENADALLDETFDETPNVSYSVTPRSMRYETVVIGARERGYRLLSESTDASSNTRTLVFTSDDR